MTTTPKPTEPAVSADSAAAGAAPVRLSKDFRRLWVGQGVSQYGSQVTVVALPLVAIAVLHAGAGELGVLSALTRLPFLLYLVAGVFVDRHRRRPVLIGTDLGRAALLGLIPVLALAGVLSLWVLAAIALASMTLSVWFDIANMSYLPAMVGKDGLAAANARLETTRATAQVAGPSLGGVLVQLLTAPVAILADALSFLVSAFAVTRIRTPEPERPPSGRGLRAVRADLAEGFRFVLRHRLLGPLALAIGVSNLVWAAETALYLVFLARQLGLPAGLIGVTLAGQGPGTMVGSAFGARVARRIGLSAAVIGGLGLFAAAALLIPAVPGNRVVAVPVLVASGFLMGLGGQVCAVNVLTTRQRLTPDRLQGRVNATFRFLILGVSPLGALAGGYAGQLLGLRTGLYIAVAGMFLAPLILLCSPLRRVRAMPAAVEDETTKGGTR
jgi:MFS family permease